MSYKYTIAEDGEDIREFLDIILATSGLRITFEIKDGPPLDAYFERPDLLVAFGGPDIEFLMANKGEGLLALEQLTQEMLGMPGDEHALICFDAHDFRLLRQEELRLSALTVAARVKETKQPYRFSPMSSRERRIIHLALRDEKELRSESSGTGPGRHVVVYPSGMPSLPEPPPQHARPPMRRGGRR
jgi:spoIIIJ-associated protein